MTIGSISKLLSERDHDFKSKTVDIIEIVKDRLTATFERLYEVTNLEISWYEFTPLSKSKQLIDVKGSVKLIVGEEIMVGDQTILVTEENKDQYRKSTQFVFPLNMLETATVDELFAYMKKINTAAVIVSDTELQKIMETESDNYANKLLEDISRLDSLTKPKEVLGFKSESLTDDQIRQLSLFAHQEQITIN